ncbi:D-glycero-beta-D-manno-heptose 1,7-bisphosphate 7-phosphatase [Thiolapillus brandeum]|uniref:D,D-heptose 1,7-bisphosphate phosphatase n=1 Tax=Thiolapillus brandeum TaxID=1076588 RepID=A0A7U6GG04_9GAMM|nr:D-glycero-beta-D-manno-heptose 1,7-bisphosphate 7-phosphatase [Thiolapillus brandeum]BAO42957.1 D-glycero-D-manno-heptose 17-bisphosphate phosphatase [Thiolapillus brandeum]
MPQAPSRHIILDRDGVINADSDDFIKSPEEWIPLEGSLEAIARLNQAGYLVGVATNQSGIGRGLFDLPMLNAMHQKMYQMLAKLGAHVDMIAFCPHLPEDHCDCRKPRAGLYQALAKRWDVSLEGLVVIGDSLRDLQAAQAVDASPVLVKTGKGAKTLKQLPPDHNIPVFDDLYQAVDTLLKEDD